MTAIYTTRVRHVRADPVRYEFVHRSYSWFIDVDEPPTLPRGLRSLARFRAEDHLFGSGTTLRDRVNEFLDDKGVDIGHGRVTALLSARVFGYVFNPLSVYWCHDGDGALRYVIAEVHNTYGQRHAYLLTLDDEGRAEIGKEFYVSPFNAVDGTYRMSIAEPGEQLAIRIVLHRNEHAPFVASIDGTRSAATTRNVLRAQLRSPLEPLMVSAKIRWHGIRLWARGLPLVERPATNLQETHR